MKLARALVLLVALPAAGADLAGNDLLIPIAGRVPGAFGSSWRTDVVITNVAGQSASVVLRFQPTDGSAAVESQLELRANATVTIEDAVQTRFDRDNQMGLLRLTSLTEGARFIARAYVYNRGSASGEFGQNVPALPVDALLNEHVITGITGTGGRRTNVGIANPWNVAASRLYLALYDADGGLVASGFRDLRPRSVVQFDPFAELGVGPLAAASLRITGGGPGVYAYASIARADSGDPVFISGSGIASNGYAAVARPACIDPAPLVLSPPEHAAPSWIVIFREGVESDVTTPLLAGRYGFTVVHQYSSALEGFSATLTARQIASLRCEEAVETVYQDQIGGIASLRGPK